MRVRISLFVVIGWLVVTAVALAAQTGDLTLGEPDASDFPLVRLRLRAAGANQAPLTQSELENLRLRENGVPISDFDVRYVPVGGDLLFVIDADTTLLFQDVADTTRLEMVKESVGRYGLRFMSPAGLDRVSVLVPNRANSGGEWLVEAADTPEALINALAGYGPQNLAEEGPVNEMVQQAIDRAAMSEDGRYRAIFLLSEARRLSQLLDYPALIEAAQAAGVPIFVGILGPEASLEDIGNASALADPSGGFYVHMPRPERADPVYLRWQQESNQPQITYTSLLRRSGVYPLTVNLGPETAVTELDLTLSPPQAAIALDRSVIRRAGTAVDTPLAELQPAVQPVPVQITWPDGLPRRLESLRFTVDGVPQPFLAVPQPDVDGRLTLEWNVQNVDVGAYELALEVTDELGLTAVADPVVVTVAVERPAPPTPTPAPTPTPPPAAQVARLTAIPRNDLLLVLAGLGLFGLVLVMLRGYRQYRERVLHEEARRSRRATLQRIQETQAAPPPPPDAEPMQAALLLLDENLGVQTRFSLQTDNITIGRAGAAGATIPAGVTIPLNDRSVSPLHARIRERHGRYWLYDEGSENGVYRNYERLGLSPQPLANGDEIRLGRLNLRFEWKPVAEVAAEAPVDETETAVPDPASPPAEEGPET